MFLCSYSYDIVDPVFDSFVWEIYVNSRRANLVASESKGSESADEVSLAFFVDRVASRDLTGHGSARIALKEWIIRFFNNNKLSQEQSKKPRQRISISRFSFLISIIFFRLPGMCRCQVRQRRYEYHWVSFHISCCSCLLARAEQLPSSCG